MLPLLMDVPETLETDRLILRCPLPGDGPAVNEALRESWADLQVWMNWAKGDPPPVEDTEARQRQARLDFLERSAFHFNMFLKETGEFVAKPSLLRLDWNVPQGEIGYWLRSSYVGQGLMTEAVVALTAFAFETLGFFRVEIRCDPENLRSAAIPERLGYLGYCKEGYLRNNSRGPKGQLRDTLVYAAVR